MSDSTRIFVFKKWPSPNYFKLINLLFGILIRSNMHLKLISSCNFRNYRSQNLEYFSYLFSTRRQNRLLTRKYEEPCIHSFQYSLHMVKTLCAWINYFRKFESTREMKVSTSAIFEDYFQGEMYRLQASKQLWRVVQWIA